MMRARVALVAAGAGLALAGLLASRQVLLLSQVASQEAVTVDPSVLTLRVRFGVEDQSERPWDGSVSVSGGEITALRNWHPRPGDGIEGRTAWKSDPAVSVAMDERGRLFERKLERPFVLIGGRCCGSQSAEVYTRPSPLYTRAPFLFFRDVSPPFSKLRL